NQLIFGVSGHYALAPELIQATIHPRVIEHDLVSLEGGYQADDVGLWVAFLLERPIRDETPAEWQTQEVSVARAVSPGMTVALGAESGVSVSYLAVSGGNAPDRGGMLTSGASASSFERRYPFANSVKLRGFASLPGPWGRRLSGRSSLLVDLGSGERAEPGRGRGMIWSTELRWASREDRGIAVAIGGDVLAADSSTGDESFIARYRANHRVHAGVSYAF
ncbi:MAG TPA: hypothetical protein VM598_14525, partial [Bdellovibrionota bacterium]|nr:hypothetical protein [Bdellovibrionota bacterium]